MNDNRQQNIHSILFNIFYFYGIHNTQAYNLKRTLIFPAKHKSTDEDNILYYTSVLQLYK